MMAEAEPGTGRGERPTVRIDPEMRALFRAWRAGPAAEPGPAEPEAAPAPADPPGAALPDPAPPPRMAEETGQGAEEAAPRPEPPLDRIRLRRDGRRPLVFEGIRLAGGRRDLALPGLSAGLAAEIELFLAGDGRLGIRAALDAGPDGPLRGQHHAALVATPGELQGFLGTIDPVASLPDPRFSDLCPAASLAGLAGTLRRDFKALAASLCGPGP